MDHNSSSIPEFPFLELTNLSGHISEFHSFFSGCGASAPDLCQCYIEGIFKTEAGKRNIERINEEIEMTGDSYQRMQQFISDAPWSGSAIVTAVAQKTSDLFAQQPGYSFRDVGYIIDESAHRKKGRHSVGVARQYAGVIGKVDNCQVGVYASLAWRTHSTLVNYRLFLPESWTDDPARCTAAGIPVEAQVFKTKIQLGLDMIHADLEAGVKIGWVGGDAFYGHGLAFGNAIENMGLEFVLDVHSDQQIYPIEPFVRVPTAAPGPGRRPSLPRPDGQPETVKTYARHLLPEQWREVSVRAGTKGPLTLRVHMSNVWIWEAAQHTLRARTLVISHNVAENRFKYSLSNVKTSTTPIERIAYMQAQRYWVERDFQHAKSELGMSDYQVRKWTSWHHHMALVSLSLMFILKERIIHKEQHPLLSCRDVRLMIIAMLANDQDLIEKRIAQMMVRHEQRRRDIERRYNHVAQAG